METAVIVQIIATIGSVAAVGIPLIVTARKDRHKANDKLLDSIKEIRSKIDELHNAIEEVKADNAQDYIVPFLADIEAGRKVPTEEEVKRFLENYRIYTEHGRNDYVHRTKERLEAAGKL